MLHIIYRASDSEKSDVRPSFYSKELSLKSLLVSVKEIKDFTFTFFYDGSGGDELIKLLKKHVAEVNITRLDHAGNSSSFWEAYKYAQKLPETDLVYFVEDDYLHMPEALAKLVNCAETIQEADYITLYDHPIRYASDYHFGLDVPHRDNTIFLSNTHHWRAQESTCMTFAARVKCLRDDEIIFDKYVHQVQVPEDRELFKRLQGLAGYEKGSPYRLLIGPLPSLATHCHEPWLAPLVNWENIAKNIHI